MLRFFRYLLTISVGLGLLLLFFIDDEHPALFNASRPVLRVIWSAIEYLVVAYLMLLAAGFGRSIRDVQLTGGVWSAIKHFLSGLFLVGFGYYIVSVCIRPGHPWYLMTSAKGQGAFILILCAAAHGFVAERRDGLRHEKSVDVTLAPKEGA